MLKTTMTGGVIKYITPKYMSINTVKNIYFSMQTAGPPWMMGHEILH